MRGVLFIFLVYSHDNGKSQTSIRPIPTGVRYGGAKRGRYRFECPYASSDEKKYGNVRCRNQSAPRCALHMGIHPDSRRSSYFFVPFLYIVIEPGCYRSFLFIIWLNCYGHHIGYLTYQWGNILNRRSNNLSLMGMTFHSHISLPFSFHSFFLTWLNCYLKPASTKVCTPSRK